MSGHPLEEYANEGAELFNEPVSLTWNELWTSDRSKAREFYGAAFGWEPLPMDEVPYDIMNVDGRPIAGVGQRHPLSFPQQDRAAQTQQGQQQPEEAPGPAMDEGEQLHGQKSLARPSVKVRPRPAKKVVSEVIDPVGARVSLK